MTPTILCPLRGPVAAERCLQRRAEDGCDCGQSVDPAEVAVAHHPGPEPSLPIIPHKCRACGCSTREHGLCPRCNTMVARDCKWCGCSFRPPSQRVRGKRYDYCSEEHEMLAKMATTGKDPTPKARPGSWGWGGSV